MSWKAWLSGLGKVLFALVLLVPAAKSAASRHNTLLDSRQRQVPLDPPPHRIVSASLASDEILWQLLSRAGATSRLIAVSPLAFNERYSNIANAVRGRLKPFGDEAESLLSLHPDLVILASFNRPELVRLLEHAGVRTFVLGDFRSLDDIAANITTLGALIHEPRVAAVLRADFTAKRAALSATHLPLPAPLVLAFDPNDALMAKGTMFDAIAHAAGARNLAADKGLVGWPKVGAEFLATLQPDALVAAGNENDRARILASARSTPGWQALKATREGQLIIIPERELLAVSPYVLEAVRDLKTGLSKLMAPKPKAATR